MTTHRREHSSWGTRMADGELSPKVTIPTTLLLLAGVILAILDLTGILDLEDEIWITLLGASGIVFPAGYSAKPGRVES